MRESMRRSRGDERGPDAFGRLWDDNHCVARFVGCDLYGPWPNGFPE